jgi:hypothetical protein
MSPQGNLNQDWVDEQSLKTGVDPELVTCIRSIQEILSYDIPQERESSFLRFQEFVNTHQLESLVPWRGHHRTTKQKWFFGCYVGIAINVRGALAAAHYHADRLGEIQGRVNVILAEPRVKQLFANSNWGLGYTRTLDTEYHAFILAFRRCLDYLAGALGCFFLREVDSFRTFPKSIAKTRFPEVAEALTEAHARHVLQLRFVLAPGRKSVRHRIAHYEFVKCGTVNLRADGFFLVGGPEDPSWPPAGNIVNLNKALDDRLDSLHACVDDMIDTFLQAVGTHQPSGAENAEIGD